jgi:hypothetical protein
MGELSVDFERLSLRRRMRRRKEARKAIFWYLALLGLGARS